MTTRTSHGPPLPRLVRRSENPETYRRAISIGVPEVAARVLARRELAPETDLTSFMEGRLASLDPPDGLADIDRAASRIAQAVMAGETIALITDYDCDGLGAHATLRRALVEMFGHPPSRLQSFVGHRLEEGYGVCEPVANRILAANPRPALLITADNGSSDEAQIARLSAAGIEVIVTDHHALPVEGPPKSAFACINPQREDCGYPDDAIAGGMVAWLLMCAVRQRLVAAGRMRGDPNPLVELLDYVAVSTQADCVSLASLNNRAVVRTGLMLMNYRQRACWAGMRPLLKTARFEADTISFGIGPRINARTRLADGDVALDFLLSDDIEKARRLATVLDQHNQARKAIEREMLEIAMAEAEARAARGRSGLAMLLADGHAGVIGLCSSRLVERFGRPAFVFAPNNGVNGTITGSGRSTEGIHLRAALQWIADREAGLFIKMGGHKAAAGATIRLEHFDRFERAFEAAVRAQLGDQTLAPYRYSDGELRAEDVTLETVQALQVLEPTGRGFEPARFDGEFVIEDARAVGDGTHLKMVLGHAGRRFGAIWFRARANAEEPIPVAVGDRRRLLYALRENQFQGEVRLDLVVETALLE